jgi:hypothetical protein
MHIIANTGPLFHYESRHSQAFEAGSDLQPDMPSTNHNHGWLSIDELFFSISFLFPQTVVVVSCVTIKSDLINE